MVLFPGKNKKPVDCGYVTFLKLLPRVSRIHYELTHALIQSMTMEPKKSSHSFITNRSQFDQPRQSEIQKKKTDDAGLPSLLMRRLYSSIMEARIQ